MEESMAVMDCARRSAFISPKRLILCMKISFFLCQFSSFLEILPACTSLTNPSTYMAAVSFFFFKISSNQSLVLLFCLLWCCIEWKVHYFVPHVYDSCLLSVVLWTMFEKQIWWRCKGSFEGPCKYEILILVHLFH